jgi:hypothetical protein
MSAATKNRTVLDRTRELRFVYRRLVCALRGHRFRTMRNHVTCARCNWCGGDEEAVTQRCPCAVCADHDARIAALRAQVREH